MKRLSYFVVLAIMSIAGTLTACGQEFTVEAEGIGPVKIGANAKNLPKQVAGLYDEIALMQDYDEFEDEYIYSYTYKLNGEDMLGAMANEAGEIYLVSAYSEKLRTKSGAYHTMKARDFIQLQGVKVILKPEADYDRVSFEIDGIPVSLSQAGFTASGQAKCDAALKSGNAPQFTPNDFEADESIFLGGFTWM